MTQHKRAAMAFLIAPLVRPCYLLGFSTAAGATIPLFAELLRLPAAGFLGRHIVTDCRDSAHS